MHVIVLAAGASTRFGSPKQLASVGGRGLLETVLDRAMQLAGPEVTVVLGADAPAIRASLGSTGASFVINDRHQEGISSSIRAGLAQLPASVEAVLVLLGDQVAVTTEDLRRLLASWENARDRIVAAQYGEVIGAPAIFPSDLFGALKGLQGDQGARALLMRHFDRVITVPVATAAIDVDTVEDLQKLQRTD